MNQVSAARKSCSRSRSLVFSAPLLVLAALVGTPTVASADNVVNFGVGYFALRGEDARAEGDVLRSNLDHLAFNLKDFNGVEVNGDWMFGIGEFVEAGVGVGFYQRTVPSVYNDYVNANGSEIEQDLKLRTIPVSLTARVFPIGRGASVQPYVGGGLAIVNWRYSEAGEFVDFRDGSIFRDTFVDKGTATGPMFLAGVRFPVGAAWLIGGEFRYRNVKADLNPDLGFADNRIDLSGFTTQFTASVRF